VLVSGRRIAVVEKARRPGDAPRLVADAEKAIREFGWQPRYAKIEAIVASAWRWHSKHPKGYPD
jgi:UDP-glucose 4-epimerase